MKNKDTFDLKKWNKRASKAFLKALNTEDNICYCYYTRKDKPQKIFEIWLYLVELNMPLDKYGVKTDKDIIELAINKPSNELLQEIKERFDVELKKCECDFKLFLP